MPVIAVDPAPGKESTLFDGTTFLRRGARGLRAYLDQPCNRTRETLLCWDAPLTGPGDPASAGTRPSDFTLRRVEQFFRLKETGFKTPKPGIAVRPYSECPHWAITRSLLGLPRTGPYDLDYRRLPYHLLPSPDGECAERASVVEVHPAVAAWLWCRGAKDGQWEYKKDAAIRNEMWSIILARTQFPWVGGQPKDDDEFDAAVAYVLGSLYLRDQRGAAEGERAVTILGDRCTGSLLLPAIPGLEQTWRAWVKDSW